jgi:hypothetical protein
LPEEVPPPAPPPPTIQYDIDVTPVGTVNGVVPPVYTAVFAVLQLVDVLTLVVLLVDQLVLVL